MAKIKNIRAREILDSRGQPTIEVDVLLDSGCLGRAAVPSGASTGAHEAHELRDGDNKRYLGKGVLQAVQNVNQTFASSLKGMTFNDFREVDEKLLSLDGSENKKNLGANSILGVSLACAQALAAEQKKTVYELVHQGSTYRLPVPLMNILNGGAHANNGLDVQEFMIVPTIQTSFREALRAGSEVFHNLKKILATKQMSTAVGDEGGFAPKLKNNEEAIQLICQAVEKAGYKLGEQILIALDVAATELYSDGQYKWENERISSQELIQVYSNWKKQYPIVSIEDGLSEDDWQGWKAMTDSLGNSVQLVGDDLFVTNVNRLQKGIETKTANAILIKVNQIGSLSETQNTIALAKKHSYRTVMSHRSGETENTIIADLAVGFDCEQIKTGSLCRGERTAKYNQLLRIEEEVGSRGQYWGRKAFAGLD